MEITQRKRKKNIKSVLKKNLLGWAFIIPALVLFAFFVWVPLGKNIVMSFFNNQFYDQFVGLDNYAKIFSDVDNFLPALKNTFVYIFYSLVIGFFIPIIIGFLLSEVIHVKGFFRVLIYLPCMISGIAVVFLFKKVYGDENYDILNIITKALGGDPHKWRSDPNLVIPLIVLAMTWRGAGSTALIYLNSFQQIDTSIYEASRIDGASPLQRFIRLTIPGISSTILTLLVLQIISVFQVFYEPMIIGGGDVSSMSLMYLTYKYAFIDGKIPLGAASAVILAILIIGFTVLYYFFKNLLEREDKKAGMRR